MITATLKKSRRVIWTEDELQRLTLEIYRERIRNPRACLSNLFRAVMDHWPAQRRRLLINEKDFRPIVERLQKLDAIAIDAVSAAGGESATAPPTREEILDSLSTEEIRVRFGERILAGLAEEEILARFGSRVLQAMTGSLLGFTREMRRPAIADSGVNFERLKDEIVADILATTTEATKPIARLRLPRICFMGLLTKQQQQLKTNLRDVVQCLFVSKETDPHNGMIPSSAEHAVVWQCFCSHGHTDIARNQMGRDRVSCIGARSLATLEAAARSLAPRIIARRETLPV